MTSGFDRSKSISSRLCPGAGAGIRKRCGQALEGEE
jgi:hypothetical protein